MSKPSNTSEEKEELQHPAATSNVEFQAPAEKISDLRSRIEKAKAQVEQMERELKDLCDEEAATTEASAPNSCAPVSEPIHLEIIPSIPKVEKIGLDITRQKDIPQTPSWANLSVLHIHGDHWIPESAVQSIACILQQTTRLVTCSVSIGMDTDIDYTGEIYLPHLKFLSVKETVPYHFPGLLKFINAPALEALHLGGLYSEGSLAILFQRSLTLQHLDVELGMDFFLGLLTEALYYCSSLQSLFISRPKWYVDVLQYRGQDFPPSFSDSFFNSFTCNGRRGYLCPNLHTFILKGGIYARVNAIRQFLTKKSKGHGTAGLNSWKEVGVNLIENCVEPDCGSQMRQLVAEQRAAGLNVSLS